MTVSRRRSHAPADTLWWALALLIAVGLARLVATLWTLVRGR